MAATMCMVKVALIKNSKPRGWVTLRKNSCFYPELPHPVAKLPHYNKKYYVVLKINVCE